MLDEWADVTVKMTMVEQRPFDFSDDEAEEPSAAELIEPLWFADAEPTKRDLCLELLPERGPEPAR